MPDVATLSLAIDSRPATVATAALNQLTAAAKPAAAAAAALQTAAAPASAALTKMQSVTAATATQTGLARHELINLSRQVQDVGVSLVSGMNPLVILAQQGTQIGDVFASTNGTMRGFTSQAVAGLRSVMTPTTLLTGGVVALGAGALLAYTNWKNFALQIDDGARSAGLATQRFSALQSAASFKGIADTDFATATEKFANQVYLAKSNAGGLADVMRANGVYATDFDGALAHAADIIKNTSSDQARLVLLQQMGLPATMQWVRFLSQGSEGIRQATAEAARFGGTFNDEMVHRAREFDEAWDRTWTNWVTRAKGAVVSAQESMASLDYRAGEFLRNLASGALKTNVNTGLAALRLGFGQRLSQDVGEIYRGFPNFKADKSNDPEEIRRIIGLDQQRIGILGNLASVELQVRQRENEITIARASGVTVTRAEEAAILDYTRAQSLGLIAIRQQTSAYQIEASTITMGVGPAAAYRAEQERLADFRLRGITLTKSQADALHTESLALGEAAQATARLRMEADLRFATSQLGRTDMEQQVAAQLRQLYGDEYLSRMDSAIAGQIRFNDTLRTTKDFSSSALSGFLRDLRDGKSATDALTNVVTKFEDKLFDIGANMIMSGLLRGLTGGGGMGLFSLFGFHSGGIVGSEPSFVRNVHPAYFDDAPRFHTGIGPGERAAVLQDGEGVFTKGQMAALAPVGRGGGNTYVTINNAPAETKATASTSRDGAGNVRVDVWLSRAIDDNTAASIATGESATNRELERRYGLMPRL